MKRYFDYSSIYIRTQTTAKNPFPISSPGLTTSLQVGVVHQGLLMAKTHFFQPSFLAGSVMPASESDTERNEVDYDTEAESLVGPICCKRGRGRGRGRGIRPANDNNPDPPPESEPHPDPPKQQLPPPPLPLGTDQILSSLTVT